MSLGSNRKQRGVTLVEVLLVMVILSSFIVMGVGYMQQRATNLRIERTAMQMQQILNAGMSYYVNNGTWPTNMAALVAAGYFPKAPTSPWGGVAYVVGKSNTNFYVWVPLTMATPATAKAYATITAGKLPFGYVSNANGTPPTESTCSGATCYVVSYVNIPGQNLNNASAINFAGLYHHGGCVPVPSCPVDKNGNTMTPSVFIVPVSVSGVNDAGEGSTNVYPISSFTGYATGGTNASPPACTGGSLSTCGVTGTAPESNKYWRACLDLITERGTLAGEGSGASSWGQYVTVMAVTRCATANEPSGSPFTIYSN